MTTTFIPWRPGPVTSRSPDATGGSPIWAQSATDDPVTMWKTGSPESAGETQSQRTRTGLFPFPLGRWTILDAATVDPSS